MYFFTRPARRLASSSEALATETFIVTFAAPPPPRWLEAMSAASSSKVPAEVNDAEVLSVLPPVSFDIEAAYEPLEPLEVTFTALVALIEVDTIPEAPTLTRSEAPIYPEAAELVSPEVPLD